MGALSKIFHDNETNYCTKRFDDNLLQISSSKTFKTFRLINEFVRRQYRLFPLLLRQQFVLDLLFLSLIVLWCLSLFEPCLFISITCWMLTLIAVGAFLKLMDTYWYILVYCYWYIIIAHATQGIKNAKSPLLALNSVPIQLTQLSALSFYATDLVRTLVYDSPVLTTNQNF